MARRGTASVLAELGYSPRKTGHSHSEYDGDEKTFGGARVRDLIQWESSGALQLPEPRRVRAVSDDGQWVFVGQSGTGIPMDQVLVEEKAGAARKGEVFALDEGDVTLIFPDSLSATSFGDLEAYLKVFLRKAERRAGAETGNESEG